MVQVAVPVSDTREGAAGALISEKQGSAEKSNQESSSAQMQNETYDQEVSEGQQADEEGVGDPKT